MPKRKKKLGWYGPELSQDQKDAVDVILNSTDPIWLCGRAGSGKSTVVNYVRSMNKKISVTATTGLAAQLISGCTIHSFAGIIPNKGAVVSHKADYRIKNTDLLIIDEASMMDEWLFTQLCNRFEMAEHEPRILLVGDFLQLPPVNSTPFYKSPLWEVIKLVKLTSYHRQTDSNFIEVLNDIRCGIYSDRVRDFIIQRTVDVLPDDCTHLMSLRRIVEARNISKLKELTTPELNFPWDVVRHTPDPKHNSKLDNVRFVSNLVVKVGARIMLLNNDQRRRWVNGSTGAIVDVNQSEQLIYVKLDAGYTVEVMRECEEVVSPDDEILFSVRQFPIMLAWASTIHKSQGSTLDKVGIDLNNHFEVGQTYVSASRCKTPDGIYFSGSLKEIKTDMDAVKIFG